MKINLDIKSILILILFGVSILFFGMWFFRGSDMKNQVKNLENQVKQIEVYRDSLKNANRLLEIDFNRIQNDIIDKDSKIKEIESKLIKIKQELMSANGKVLENQKRLDEIKKKISDLEKNPINRIDQDLINSLKEKLK